MTTISKDYYNILEISRDASPDEIKKSYKKKALKYHPDRNLNNKDEAEEKFKEISIAYQVLSDTEKKKNYDLYGTVDNDNFDASSMNIFNEIFKSQMDSLFGNNFQESGGIKFTVHTFTQPDPINIENRFQDAFSNIKDTLRDSVHNTVKKSFGEDNTDIFGDILKNSIRNTVNNIPKKNNKNETFIKTKTKKVVYIKKSPDLVFNINASLKDIYNKKIKKLKIERYRKTNKKPEKEIKKIKVPLYGRTIRLEGEGNELEGYINSGDLVINVNDIIDNKFKRINYGDLITTVDIKLSDIYNGKYFDLIHINDEILNIYLEKGSLINQTHLIQKINGKGLPYYNEYNEEVIRGDLYIRYLLQLPNSLNELKEIKQENNLNNQNNLKYIIPRNCEYSNVYSHIEA